LRSGTPWSSTNESHAYANAIARRIAELDLGRHPLSAKEKRAGKLFLDCLRNGCGTTAVWTYSPRARPMAALT
jgi:bifunctional non-homologous end joining protein LigD